MRRSLITAATAAVAVVVVVLATLRLERGRHAPSSPREATKKVYAAGAAPRLGVPASIRREHQALHEQLDQAIHVGGRTGEAASRVAALLEPHFVKEERFALPPLGVLRAFADGEVTADTEEVLALTERFRAGYPKMLEEHEAIVAALGELLAAARAEEHPQATRFAQELMRHAESEEEILYPATILIGEYLKLAAARNAPLGQGIAPTVGSARAGRIELSDHALAMANVETTQVSRRDLSHELRTVGKVQYNEASLATVTARVDGYAERLFVNFTGVQIKAGDHLAEVYSPALVVAQQELLLGQRDGLGPMVELAGAKLRRWGLTEQQVRDLVENKRPADRITLVSPIAGTVIEKNIVQNSAFKAGDPLYRVANLDTVWVYLDVYEYDLPWVRFGQPVELTAEALPGRVVTGRVTFVQPVLNEETRTVRVPVHVANKGHALKPGMFVNALVRSRLAADGSAAPTGVEGKFSCVMHPRVLRDEPGKCPVCEMPLEQIPGVVATAPSTVAELAVAVPVSAVLDAGTRRIVYVERTRGLFESREVVLGPRSGEWFPVLRGVDEGERVVTRGGFLIDSQFQITGRPSLFYPGGAGGAVGHQHGGAPASAAGVPAPSGAPPPEAGEHRH